MNNENFKNNNPQKVRLIKGVLDGSVSSTITLDDLTCQGLFIIENVLQGDHYIRAASILVTLCKSSPVDLSSQLRSGACFECQFHSAHSHFDGILEALGRNASSEHLFDMAFNNETSDKKLFMEWLLNRLNQLSGAIFIDAKDNAICIWEKGALKRSQGLSQSQLDIFFSNITKFYNFKHLDFKSKHATSTSSTSTLFPLHSNYSSASSVSSSSSFVTAKNNFVAAGVVPESYQVGSAIANGDCLFDSVAQLINTGQNAHDLRLLAVNYMRSHKEEFADFFVDKELDTRIALMTTSLEHADHYEVLALAKALQRQIIVISNNKALPALGDVRHPVLYLHHESIEFEGEQVGHYQPFILRNPLSLANLKN